MENSSNQKIIFVVGNPRSGTTMLGLILGRHHNVHIFNELHFFDKLWDPTSSEEEISVLEGQKLELHLGRIEINETLNKRGREDNAMPEDSACPIDPKKKLQSIEIYKNFLFLVTQANNKTIPCEQTPGYLYYVDEIQRKIPQAVFVNIIRDPRDVLLSQKKKWISQNLKKEKDSLFENIRLWVNYHPITTSFIWRAAIKRSRLHTDKNSFINIQYEDILQSPKNQIKSLCEFLEIQFSESMLDISRSGSSIKNYSEYERGIDSKRKTNWMQEGLSNTEIFLCQKINKEFMKQLGYITIPVNCNAFSLLYSFATFPIKLFTTFLLHLCHFKNLSEAIKRRFF